MRRFPLIDVSGEPLERGRRYGEQVADLIRFNLEGYWRLFEHYTGLNQLAALDQASQYLPAVQGYAPHLLEEMRGIAEGADVSLNEILALNCRTEILSYAAACLYQECTAILVAPEVTTDGHTFLAQNWGWAEILRGGAILLRIEQPGQPTVLTLTEAGIVGKIGFNSAGVGVGTNSLKCYHRRYGVPYHVILREALNASRLGLAISAVYRDVRADSGNYLLAHADGEAIDLEATPSAVGFLHPDRGLLVHTNHFLTSRLQAGDRGILKSDNTLLRYGRVTRLLCAKNLDEPNQGSGQITGETVKRILRDHFDDPNSICRHADPAQPEIERFATRASMIVDLTTSEMHVTVGEPCQAEYYTVGL